MTPIRNQYPIQNETIVGKIVDNEAVLVIPETGKVKVLNDVGARVWSLSDGQHSVENIIAIISNEYQVDPEQVEVDVLEFIKELLDKQIIILQYISGAQTEILT